MSDKHMVCLMFIGRNILVTVTYSLSTVRPLRKQWTRWNVLSNPEISENSGPFELRSSKSVAACLNFQLSVKNYL